MSDSEDRRPISWRRNDDTGRRRRTAGRRDRSSSSSRSPSYEERHRSRSRSPSLSEWGTRSSSPSWSLSDWGSSSPSSRSSRSSRSPSRSWRNRSRSPSRQLRRSPASPHQNGHRAEEQEDAQDRRVRDRSPINRGKRSGRSRSLSYRRRDLRIGRSRSRSPDRRRGPPRSCRSRSRTRSDECEDRRCCRPGQQEEDEEQYMSHDDEDVFVRIDSYDRLFTCAQCHDLLSPPVYECAEGHVTCARCHASANEDGEPSCRLCGERNYGRGRAAEGWLSSIRFPCRNHAHGCAAYRPRHAIDAHERACRHAPCFCPVRRCGFPGGARAALERHLTSDHGWAVVGFRYGQPFAVGVGDHAPRQVLRAEEDGEMFHLRAKWRRGATALSMACIRPDNAAEAELTYQVRTPLVEGVPHRMQVQAPVWGTSLEHERLDEGQVRVTVPDAMFPRDGPDADSVEVRIDRIAPAAAGTST